MVIDNINVRRKIQLQTQKAINKLEASTYICVLRKTTIEFFLHCL